MILTVLGTISAIVAGFAFIVRFSLGYGANSTVNENVASEYDKQFDFKNTDDETRVQKSWDNTGKYYDLVTDFYLWGWGNSFHFAPRAATETLAESVKRHEYYLAKVLDLKPEMKCLDIGCGVGGPMQNIARFSGAKVTGVNNHSYQVSVGQRLLARFGMTHLCEFFKSNFMSIGKQDASYDAAYAIEATCHAGDRVGCYKEIYRLLKPGSLLAAYEWCMTDKYDPNNPEHVKCKENIMKGDGLPCILSTHEVVDAMKKAGFEDVESVDLALVTPENPIPWYQPFIQAISFTNMQSLAQSWLGIILCHAILTILETIRLVPSGSVASYKVLMEASKGLKYGGENGIFTPCFLIKGRKPAH